jgi:hypothetical protein
LIFILFYNDHIDQCTYFWHLKELDEREKKKKLNEKHTRRENLYKTNYIRVNFVWKLKRNIRAKHIISPLWLVYFFLDNPGSPDQLTRTTTNFQTQWIPCKSSGQIRHHEMTNIHIKDRTRVKRKGYSLSSLGHDVKCNPLWLDMIF